MSKTKEIETKLDENPVVSKFTKKQIISSKRFIEKRDILNALLKDGKEYTFEDISSIIDEFMKGKV